MKKTYLKPEMMLTIVSTGTHFCIGSPNKTNPTDLDDVSYGGDNPGSFSRSKSVWDEED